MSPAVKKYLLCAILSAIIGLVFFFIVAAPPSENAPKGPLEIGAGLYPYASVNRTEITVDVPENTIDVKVTFRFKEAKELSIYALFPYRIAAATPYAIHNSEEYPNTRHNIGNFSKNFLNTVYGSSIVNATLDLNATFPFFQFVGPDLSDEITLGIIVRLRDSLVAINYPFGASQTVMLTFFGDTSGVITDEMYAFKPPGAQITIDEPFTVYLRIPSSTYYSESHPSPIEYYVKGDNRWIMFSMDFLDGRYAQTLFCSFANPAMQAWKEVFVFVGGVLVAISGSFMVEIVRHNVEGKKALNVYLERLRIRRGQRKKER